MTALLLITVILMGSHAYATTAKWLKNPSYEAIYCYSESAFKCKTSGKYTLIGLDGTDLIQHEFDSITDFTEGIALVLEKTDDPDFKWKILGFFTKDNTYTKLDENYYTSLYSFFSEEAIAVNKDQKEKGYGYLDSQGKEITAFNYEAARPFIKGWACVKLKGRDRFIDKKGKSLRIKKTKAIQCTSFNQQGLAVVIDNNNQMAVIHTDGRVAAEDFKVEEGKTFYRKYDRAFDTTGVDFIPPRNQTPLLKTGSLPIPASQFQTVSMYDNGCAIVKKSGKYGILKLTDEIVGFTMNPDGNIVIDPDKKQLGELDIEPIIPDHYNNVVLHYDPGDGELKEANWSTGKHISFIPQVGKKSKECSIRLKIQADNLLLLDTLFTKKVTRVQTLNIALTSPEKVGEKANSRNMLKVKTTVTNNTNASVTVAVNFSANFKTGNHFNDNAGSEDIPARSSKDFYATIYVTDEETVLVTATAQVSGKKKKETKQSKIRLLPNDI